MRSLCLLVGLALPAAAQAQVELHGAIGTENFVGIEHLDFLDFRNANFVELKLSAKPHEQVEVHADLQFQNTNFTAVRLLDDLWDRSAVEPVSWRIDRASMAMNGFLLDSDLFTLDLTAGKQRLSWGEADGLNPTNLLDPYDLENPQDFKERIGNVSLKAVLTVAEELFAIEAVVVPRFLPSVLPIDLFLGDDILHNPLMPSTEGLFAPLEPLGFAPILHQPSRDKLSTATPAPELAQVMGGARVLWTLVGFDWAVSYTHGRQLIPVPTKVAATGAIVNAGQGDCPPGGKTCLVVDFGQIELRYPSLEVVGLSARGAIGDLGVWGEVALLLPEAVETEIGLQVPIVQVDPIRVPMIEDEPFTKWVLGAEYTIPGGFYLNLQWVHGFLIELTAHRLHDYLFLVARKSFLSDRLKFELNLGGELDTNNGARGLGATWNASVAYRPFDGSEVTLGVLMARGDEGTTLDLFQQLDQAYLKFRADF